jgi:hypothetical protein
MVQVGTAVKETPRTLFLLKQDRHVKMDSRLRGNDGIHSGASGPANVQYTVIERTLNIRKRYQSRNISPPSPFAKGD